MQYLIYGFRMLLSWHDNFISHAVFWTFDKICDSALELLKQLLGEVTHSLQNLILDGRVHDDKIFFFPAAQKHCRVRNCILVKIMGNMGFSGF